MPNPLKFLQPALELLGNNVDILPATGAAVEDMLVPDPDELEDTLVNRESQEITDFLETPMPSISTIYRPTPPLFRKENHLFRFFIDGSLRTYYIGTGIEGNRSFPIELAQIGSAVVQRDDQGRATCLERKQKVLLLVPSGGYGLSDTVWKQLEQLNMAGGIFEAIDITKKTALTSREAGDDDLRQRAGAIARHRMHELEIELIQSTEGQRSDGSWLILDGAVKLDDFIQARYLIGVAKSFRKNPIFLFGSGRRRERRDITSILAGLQYACRTVAFAAHGGKVAFWYVRLRPQEELDYPLMGVVKVELPRPERSPVPADLADLLSSALVAERNVTPYGRDRRWHCHLYPIFTAEQAIKANFFSQDVLVGAIRWPRP